MLKYSCQIIQNSSLYTILGLHNNLIWKWKEIQFKKYLNFKFNACIIFLHKQKVEVD